MRSLSCWPRQKNGAPQPCSQTSTRYAFTGEIRCSPPRNSNRPMRRPKDEALAYRRTAKPLKGTRSATLLGPWPTGANHLPCRAALDYLNSEDNENEDALTTGAVSAI